MGYMQLCFIFVYLSVNNLCHSSVVKIGVILPSNSLYPWSITQVLPAIQIAVEHVRQEILPQTRLEVSFADSECSSTKGPLAAFDLYIKRVNVFLGPVCNYAVAPVARYSPYWDVPVITAGASAGDFEDKSEFKLLTRVYVTTSNIAENIIQFTRFFNRTQIALLYEHEMPLNDGPSECFFNMQTIHKNLKVNYGISSHYEKISTKYDLKQILQTASSLAKGMF